MLSARGAIATNVAMVECASGQNANGKDVFLLSELEKVWVTICIIVRRHLLDGKNVQIPNFGSFWAEERCLINDTTRYRQRYNTRQVRFGINQNFALRYGIDSVKSPLEKPGLSYVKVHAADVVDVCAVPAHTAIMALKEFIMYLGEGLYCGRTFQLSFPGVASIVIKKERFMLTMDAELMAELYDMDSRRWPPEMQALGREKLEAARMPGSSASSSRPSTRASRPSTGTSTATTASGPRPVFNPAAPKDRLFADIEKEAARRRAAEARQQEAQLEEAWRQERLDRAMSRCDRYVVDEDGGMTDTHRAPRMAPRGSTATYRPATRESVYDWVDEEGEQHGEPEVEVIEVITEVDRQQEGHAALTGAGSTPPTRGDHRGRPTAPGKDAELEAILRQEEVFSRPVSRRRDYAEHTSVRDLIYSSTAGEEARLASRRATSTRVQRYDPTSDHIAIPPQHLPPPAASAVPAAPQHGRKRHTEYYSTNDSVGALLKDPLAE